MARRKLVGPVADRAIELSASHSNAEICSVLCAEFGVSVTEEAVRKFLRGVRQERAEQTKALVHETVRATLPGDLQILNDVIRKEKEWFDCDDLKLSERVMVAKELRQAIDTKLKYSGAGEQEQQIVVKWADDDDPE